MDTPVLEGQPEIVSKHPPLRYLQAHCLARVELVRSEGEREKERERKKERGRMDKMKKFIGEERGS